MYLRNGDANAVQRGDSIADIKVGRKSQRPLWSTNVSSVWFKMIHFASRRH